MADLNRTDYKLVETCSACPEQYDVYLDEQMVGYLRLRHGSFSASYPDTWGEVVYRASPEGDGIFEPYERNRFLNEAIAAIDHRHHNPPVEGADHPAYNQDQQGWSYL